MRIEHAALWVRDLETMKGFYLRFFGARAGDKYRNPRTGFESYFLSFESGARLELMWRADVTPEPAPGERIGFAHIAWSAGSRAAVDTLSLELQRAGFRVVSGPRVTGDGYYESVVLDPEQNRLEITATE